MRKWVVAFLIITLSGIAPARAGDAYAPSQLTAAEIFAKAAAARGHLRPGAYHRVSETTRSGGTVHTDVFQDGDDYRETQREGDYVRAYGAHGGVEWEQDENGSVTIVSGFHDSADPFASALAKPKNVADSPIRVLGVTTAQPAAYVVEVEPEHGLTQLRYYDAKTFLLRRVDTTDYSGNTTTYEYGGFRTAYGLTFATTISYQDQHPENAAQTRVVSFEPAPRGSVHGEAPPNKPLFDLAGGPAVQIPAEFTEHGIIVRVTIAGRGLDFELDSGASSMVIDADVARQLGLTVSDVHKESFGGDFTDGRTRAADVALGNLHARNVTMEAIPYSDMVGDRKVVGLLGGDFFATERVAVNFKNDTLSVLPPSAQALPAPWVAMPIEVDDRVPRAHAKFNAVDGAFIVDLGADETMLYPHFFKQFHPNRTGDVMGQVVGVAGKAFDYHRYTFSRFDFGDLAFADANAIVASGTKFEDLDYDGLLGRNILSEFNLVFDYPNRRLYVESLVQ